MDAVLLVLLLAFAVRGILRGTIAQVFALVGFIAGLWVAALIADWVGAHWRSARPAIVFVSLRWLVAVLAGSAIAALFQWWGEVAAKAAHDGPFGWLDRLTGAVIGAALGLVVSTLMLLALSSASGLSALRHAATSGMATRPLLVGGEQVSAAGRGLPGGLWLHEQFARAVRRLPPKRAA